MCIEPLIEFRRAAVRILSNYGRLTLNIILSLAIVPVLLLAVGSDGFALISLAASTVGFALVLDEIVQNSMIRDLAAALHADEGKRFRRMFSSTLVASAIAALFLIGVFALLIMLLPLLVIPEQLMPAARSLVIAKGAETFVVVLLAPYFNLYLVTERMFAFNAWLAARRGSLLIAAVTVLWLHPVDPGEGVIWFGWIAAGLHTMVMVASVIVISLTEPRSAVAPFEPSRDDLRKIASSGRWNALYFVTQLLTLQPVGVIIMNQIYGLYGVLVLTLAAQLAGYVRMATSGLVGGIDAVAARLSVVGTQDDQVSAMRLLVNRATLLQALIAAPAAVGIFAIATPLLQVWLGGRLNAGPQELVDIATLTRVLVVACFAMAFGDAWMRILYGAGRVRRYSPVLSIANALTPLASLALLIVLPEPYRLLSVAMAYAALLVVSQLIWLPFALQQTLGVPAAQIFALLWRPGLIAVASAAIFLTERHQLDSLTGLLVGVAAYASLYMLASWFVTLDAADRSRFLTFGKYVLASRR